MHTCCTEPHRRHTTFSGCTWTGQCSRAKSAHSNPGHRGCMGCRSPRCSNQCNTNGYVVLCRRAACRAAAGPPQLHILVDACCMPLPCSRAVPAGIRKLLEVCVSEPAPSGTSPVVYLRRRLSRNCDHVSNLLLSAWRHQDPHAARRARAGVFQAERQNGAAQKYDTRCPASRCPGGDERPERGIAPPRDARSKVCSVIFKSKKVSEGRMDTVHKVLAWSKSRTWTDISGTISSTHILFKFRNDISAVSDKSSLFLLKHCFAGETPVTPARKYLTSTTETGLWSS